FDPLQRLGKKDVRAVAFGRDEAAVFQNDRIEIRIARRIAATAGIRLPDATAPVNERVIETAMVRLIRGLIAEMPLAKNPGGVARLPQHLGDGRGVGRQPLALENRVRDAVAELVPARHQRRARGRAGWTDIEIREANALAMEAIEVRRFENGISMAAQ